MKRALVLGLTIALLLPLLISSCAVVAPASTTKSPSNGGTPTVVMAMVITADEFAADAHPVKDVTLDLPGSFTVKLAANPTTGYSWSENATISAPVVIQASYNYVAPTTDLVGAPGEAVWVFDAAQSGTGTISLSYARPWESVPPTWTLTINVTVK